MAIPTQFSVTKKAKRPIANPVQPVDGANPLAAEDVGFISGASALPAEASFDIGAPVELTSQAAADIDGASLFSALSVGTIDNPSIVTAESVAPVDNASLIGAESEAVISTPTPFTAKAGTQTSGDFPLNHARILYRNLLESSAVVSTGGAGDSFSLIPNTWQRWTFGASSDPEIIFTMPAVTPMDTFCIGVHNLNSIGSTVDFYYDTNLDGPIDFVLGTVPPSSDGAIMLHLSSKPNIRRLRIVVRGGGGDAYIGYISAGIALQMQRPFFNGHQPYSDSDVTEYYSNRTESGNIIGRQIRRRGFETTYEWQNIDDEWYRANIPEFKEYAKIRPMFIAWNLLEYPDDVAFGETTGDIATSMQNGTRIRRNGLSFTLRGV